MKKLLFILLICTVQLACSPEVIYVSSPRPELPEPARPELYLPTVFSGEGTVNLEEAKKKLHPADLMMMINSYYIAVVHIETLENIIKRYNHDAKLHNEAIRRRLLKDTDWAEPIEGE